ncbi:hypothetical protein TRIUR3_08958 [Triticum urartu]|uniref:CHCH domain-containing protein n=1 Tax=Triticum urartu TaxID=4572 RepID=M7ZMK3_TRIUA|nr:hypothetical protein TRIUR3_08958 [Triticum urartu]
MAAAHAEAAASPTHRASIQATSTPPYPSAARIADSSCFPQYTASLKCLETNQDKSKCQQQFDDYKECKKREGGGGEVLCDGDQYLGHPMLMVDLSFWGSWRRMLFDGGYDLLALQGAEIAW